MGGQIVKISSSCDVGLYSPWKIGAVVIECSRRLCETYLYIDNISYLSLFNQLSYFLEIGQISAVVSYKTRNTCFLRYTVDASAVFITCGHRLFYINRLAGFHRHNSKCSVRRRRSGNINSIDILVAYQFLSICIPSRYIVTACIRFYFFFVTAHYCYYFRTVYHIEGRSTLFLGYFTATDKSPAYVIQLYHSVRCMYQLKYLLYSFLYFGVWTKSLSQTFRLSSRAGECLLTPQA